jgi:transposase
MGVGRKKLERNLIMKPKRNFSLEFKRQVVEELLGGVSPAQITRRYNLAGGLIYYWKQQYAKGRFGNEPDQAEAFKERIKELERMVGRLTMDNDLLKKALQTTLATTRKNDSSLLLTVPAYTEQCNGGAK